MSLLIKRPSHGGINIAYNVEKIATIYFTKLSHASMTIISGMEEIPQTENILIWRNFHIYNYCYVSLCLVFTFWFSEFNILAVEYLCILIHYRSIN
jgi:hypothetical protein